MATSGRIWTADEWHDAFAAAWAADYQEPYVDDGSDRSHGRLREILAQLDKPQLLAAQEHAPRMFAEFLAMSDERTLERRHPFSFFVQVWRDLRVAKRGADWPVTYAERKREEARRAERERTESAVAATERRVRELLSFKPMSEEEQADVRQTIAAGRAAREAERKAVAQ